MDQATPLWLWWQSLLSAFATVFTQPGWVRFVPWVTGMVWCWEEHPLTQLLTALGLESRWRVLEHVAEDGAWDREAVERQMLRLLEQERPARWGASHPLAVDETQWQRPSTHVWGACPVHEASARSPHRAETVRAHHWVGMGDLGPGRPWRYLPHAARRYVRQKPWPPGDTFRPKTALAVELLGHAEAASRAPLLAVVDGASAVAPVVRSCLDPAAGRRRIELVTRRRADARVDQPVVSRPRAKGRPAKWGRRLPSPPPHRYWPTVWPSSRAWGDGRRRQFQDTQRQGRGAVSGPQLPVHVWGVQRAGDEEPWFLVTSALDLSAAPVVEAWAARCRQAEGFRDPKQRLGMAACRAWTKEPILRTVQVQLMALTLWRLLHARLDQAWGAGTWWRKPEWNQRKRHASILDRRCLFWRYRAEFAHFLVSLEDLENIPHSPALNGDLAGRVT